MLRIIFKIIHKSVLSMFSNCGVEYAGYIAFLSLLSLFPFIIFLTETIRFVSQIFGFNKEVMLNILGIIGKTLPENIIAGISGRTSEIISGPQQTLLTIAMINIIWTSSSIIEGLRTTLNIALRVKNKPPYLATRLMSIMQFLIIIIVITISLILITILPSFESIISQYFKIKLNIYTLSKFFGSSILILLMFLAYTALPNKKPNFIPTICGIGFVAISWYLTTIVFTLCIRHFSQLSLIYGSLGSIIVVLMFFYLLAFCFILGAEIIHQIEIEMYKNLN